MKNRKQERRGNKRLTRAMAVLVAFALYGCGSVSYDTATSTDNAASAKDMGEVYEENYEVEDAVDDEVAQEDSQVQQDSARKLIKTVDFEVETEEYEALIVNISNRVEALGGYIESSSIFGRSYYNDGTRNANLTIRIPEEKLDEFVTLVEEGSNVTSKSENVQDVTLTYVDLQSHKEALLVEEERLLVMLGEAGNLEETLQIESRLTEIRYQRQRMESQLRTYDNLISYATVNLYITEVVHITAVDKQSAWSEISTGFSNSIYQVGRGLRNFAIGFIIRIPYLLIWGIVITIILLVMKGIRKRAKRKKEKREQEIALLHQENKVSEETNE